MKVLALPLLTIAGLAVVAVATSGANFKRTRQLEGVMAPPLIIDESCNTRDGWTKPPPGAIVVDASNYYAGSFQTVTAGVASLANTTMEQTLFIANGVYSEQVTIPPLLGPLTILGQSCLKPGRGHKMVTLQSSMSSDDISPALQKDSNLLSSTMVILSQSGVRVYHLSINNNAKLKGSDSSAGAVYVAGTDTAFYLCNFVSARGTLTALTGFQLYVQCWIQGDEDLITGLSFTWFEACDIVTTSAGWITANGNNQSEIRSEFVLNKANVKSLDYSENFLGRPGGRYARTVFQDSYLSTVDPKGWLSNKNESTDTLYFYEYKNKGPSAATGNRVAFSGQLKEPKKITDLLGLFVRGSFIYDSNFM